MTVYSSVFQRRLLTLFNRVQHHWSNHTITDNKVLWRFVTYILVNDGAAWDRGKFLRLYFLESLDPFFCSQFIKPKLMCYIGIEFLIHNYNKFQYWPINGVFDWPDWNSS